jgi:hypothetical protein
MKYPRQMPVTDCEKEGIEMAQDKKRNTHKFFWQSCFMKFSSNVKANE